MVYSRLCEYTQHLKHQSCCIQRSKSCGIQIRCNLDYIATDKIQTSQPLDQSQRLTH